MSVVPTYRDPYPRLQPDGLRGREPFPYRAHPSLLAAAHAALELDMPLLLTGEAGCGKTDFAFAVAYALEGKPPLQCYVRSDSRARDLLYHYDSIRRFGDAQHGGELGRRRAENAHEYIRLHALGEALMDERRRVVLIDEIDKAPRDLPNDLLRELDQGGFEIPEIPRESEPPGERVRVADPSTYRNQMERPNADVRPIVIITSNVERQLPDPFLRRCVFFHIPFPDGDALNAIVRGRLAGQLDELPFLEQALEVFGELRALALTKRPSTSELIGWVRVLNQVHERRAVTHSLEHFLKTGRVGEREWSELPALGCLVKLREDHDRICGHA